MIFTSEAGRRLLHERYRELLATWPVPSDQRLLPTREGETFIVSSGPVAAPPLVLLHGSASTTLEWIGDVAAWSEHFRVHAVDLLGEPGLSAPVRPALNAQADWLDDVLEGLGIHAPTRMVARSLGGWFALDYAVRRPGRVERLALLTPAGIGRQKSLIFVPALFLQPFGRWGTLQTMRLVAGPLPSGDATEYGRFALQVHEHFRPRRVRLPVFTDEQLAKLDLLVIVGGRDRMLDAQETKRRLPEQTVVLPKAGHMVPAQTERVLEWLRK
ncbi:alpha/beta fold hydrolase [Kribbella sp. NPDC050241]|uniref:alpha/beta fold hydrolase n=1 Tax=Kribbella sp. NPDC050241 TaxID=3364115 RepID=UPI00378D04C7